MSEKIPTQTDGTQKEPIKVSFSVPQIIGSALAAATAAAIGSQLGVAGTILGAAVASLVGGIAGTVYSAGLDQTHRRVRKAIQRGYGKVGIAEPTDEENVATSEGMPEAPDADQLAATLVDLPAVVAEPAIGREYRARLWKRTAVTTVVIFVLAVVTVTAVELGLGRSLDGSGSTTVGQVTNPRTPSVHPAPTPTASAPTQQPSTPTPTPVPTPTHTQDPTPAPTISPAPTPTQHQDPTPASSQS